MTRNKYAGSSIVEVVVMMLIISISIVGIYSMVNNGQKLAKLTDDRLTALNIAKEGLESVWALRDTFVMKSFSANGCFFTTDGKNYSPLCPLTSETYIFTDAKTLVSKTGDFTVCINPDGWYSQEKMTNAANSCIATATPICWWTLTSSCRTRFSRKVDFEKCSTPQDLKKCIKARVEVTWWTTDKIKLEQEFTKK